MRTLTALGAALALAGCSTSSAPACAPAENLDAGAPYSQGELPSGACSSKGTCSYLVMRACSNPTFVVDRWACTCDGATWSCAVTAAATTICSDAGK